VKERQRVRVKKTEEEEREALYQLLFSLCITSSFSLCDSGLIKRAPSFFLFFSKAKEQPPTAVPV